MGEQTAPLKQRNIMMAGVKYSWHKYHEAMFMLDVWGEMEQWYQDDISKKRFY